MQQCYTPKTYFGKSLDDPVLAGSTTQCCAGRRIEFTGSTTECLDDAPHSLSNPEQLKELAKGYAMHWQSGNAPMQPNNTSKSRTKNEIPIIGSSRDSTIAYYAYSSVMLLDVKIP